MDAELEQASSPAESDNEELGDTELNELEIEDLLDTMGDEDEGDITFTQLAGFDEL